MAGRSMCALIPSFVLRLPDKSTASCRHTTASRAASCTVLARRPGCLAPGCGTPPQVSSTGNARPRQPLGPQPASQPTSQPAQRSTCRYPERQIVDSSQSSDIGSVWSDHLVAAPSTSSQPTAATTRALCLRRPRLPACENHRGCRRVNSLPPPLCGV